jgi:hypothetical protein
MLGKKESEKTTSDGFAIVATKTNRKKKVDGNKKKKKRKKKEKEKKRVMCLDSSKKERRKKRKKNCNCSKKLHPAGPRSFARQIVPLPGVILESFYVYALGVVRLRRFRFMNEGRFLDGWRSMKRIHSCGIGVRDVLWLRVF